MELHTGDAAAVSGEEKLRLIGVTGEQPSEILLFDLA
jgi:hypothetical protein